MGQGAAFEQFTAKLHWVNGVARLTAVSGAMLTYGVNLVRVVDQYERSSNGYSTFGFAPLHSESKVRSISKSCHKQICKTVPKRALIFQTHIGFSNLTQAPSYFTLMTQRDTNELRQFVFGCLLESLHAERPFSQSTVRLKIDVKGFVNSWYINSTGIN